ncbi:MAG: AI-2E family transporter [Syntrophomonadaceae bacterium]|jgi:predicted PurR-regulated permease PerM
MALKGDRIIRYVLFLVVMVATIYFLYLVREVLLSFLIGGILAYLLFRPVLFIERKGLKRTWAIILLYFLMSLLVAAFFSFTVPGIIKELGQLAELFPRYADSAQDVADRIDNMPVPIRINDVLQENINKIENYIIEGLNRFVGGFLGFLNMILALIFSPILAFYIMNDWEKIKTGFFSMFSHEARRDVALLLNEIDQVIFEFIKGNFLVALLVGIMIGLAAALLGVNFPLLIGIVSGITNLIPYFGAFLGGIPAIAIALTESLRQGIYMAVAIILVQQLEGNIITPKIIGDRLGMHPLLIVFALLAGGKLFGIWGMVFAVPITAALKVILSWAFLKIVDK